MTKSSPKSPSGSSFTELRAVDNFYQTSLFFPMPAVLVSTLTDDGPLPEGADHYELEKYHDFNGITSPYGAHFVLRIDKILMKPRYRDAIVNGVRAQDFPPLPVDYGYRDSKNFWYHKHRRLLPELLPQRQTTVPMTERRTQL